MDTAITGAYRHKETRKEIYRLAWPSILEQILIMLVGMVSMMFVGQIGKEAIAAVGTVNSIIFFIQSIFAALSTGATVLVARLTGEGDLEKARAAVLQSVVIAVFSAVTVTVACYIMAYPILKLFMGAAEPKVFELSLQYYKISLISLPLLIINIVVGGSFRGAGDTRTPMYVSFVVNIVNVALSYILIFGRGIMEPMGVVGAAYSVTVSRTIGALLIVWILYSGKGIIALSWKDGFKPDMELIRRIFHVGLPASLEQVVMQGGFLAMQVLVVAMGTLASAVYQITNSINSLAIMPIFGFSLAATTLVGQNLGRQDPDMAEECSAQTLYISIAIISFIGMMLFIFAPQMARLYTQDPEVIALASQTIRFYAIGEPMLATMNVVSAVLRGAGDIKYVMYTSIIGIWMFRILLSYVFDHFFHLGVIGVWIAIIIDFAIRSGMYYYRFRVGKWKYIKV